MPEDEAVNECPYCGFEIGTDDCTCGGLMHITKAGEPSQMDILVGTGEDHAKEE